MPKTLCWMVLLALLGADPADVRAWGGLNLAWEHCYADGGTSRTLFDCATNVGAEVLIASVSIPADMPRFAAATVVINVFVADGTLPPWWQVATGQCRANAVVAAYDPTSFPASEHCPAIWGETVPLQVQAIQPGVLGQDMFRATSTAAVPAGAELPLLADGTDRVVCRLLVRHAKSVGEGACAGCRVGACFWLSEIYLQQPDAPSWRVTGQNWNVLAGHNADATYRVDSGPYNLDCTTPALNRTWGAIKAMYR